MESGPIEIPAPPAPPTVGAGWARLLLDGLSAVGFDAGSYCGRKGWDLDRLADAQARLPWSEMVALWEVAARSTGDPALGLRAAAALPFRIQGSFGYLVMTSPTLLDGLSLMIRYQSLHFDGNALSLHDRGEHYAIRVSLPAEIPHQVEYVCALLKRTCAWVVGPGFHLTSVRFRHAGPAPAIEHERLFECPVEFQQPENALLLERRIAGRPSLYAHAEMLASARAIADRTLAALRCPPWVLRVRRALEAGLAAGHGVDELARQFGFSARSLQRRLSDEGSSVAKVLDQVRRERALELIQQSDITLTAIASQLGFADARVFTRAFRRWTGLSPSLHRARSRPGPPPR